MNKPSIWQRAKGFFTDPDHGQYIETEEYIEIDTTSEWDNDSGITNISDYREGRSRIHKNSDTIALQPKRNISNDSLYDSSVSPGSLIVKAEPKTVDQASDIGNLIKQGKIVAVQMEGVATNECQRIMDFLSGVTHALEGQVSELSTRIFMIAPKGVEVSEQHMNQLKESGIEFNSKSRRRNRA